MEEEIDASPTSQKNRKRSVKCRMSQRKQRTETSNVDESKDQNNSFKHQQSTINNSQQMIHNNIWQSAYLLEEADKLPIVSKKRLEFNRCNRNEFVTSSGPAGFVSLSQLCASQPSTSANVNGLNSQWDVTESQFQLLDNVVKNFQEPEVENAECRTADRIQDDENVLEESKEENSGDHTSKRRSSMLESILSEWQSSSPVKMTKKESTQVSPRFIFNRKRSKKTYSSKRKPLESRKMLAELASTSPTTSLRTNEIEAISDVVDEICPQPATTTDEGDEDFNDSIFDNIQNLSKFFSQPNESTLSGDKTDSTTPNMVVSDDEDFLGFDTDELASGLVSTTLPKFYLQYERKLTSPVTLPERFYEFDSDSSESSSSSHSITDKWLKEKLLADDDDIFVNIQTQQVTPNDGDGVSHPSKNSIQTRNHHTGATNKVANIFEDIANEIGEPVASTSKFNFSAFSTTVSNMKATGGEHKLNESCLTGIDSGFVSLSRPQAFEGFTTVTGKPIAVPSTLIAKQKNIFENLSIGDDEMKKMNNWISNEVPCNQSNTSNHSLASDQRSSATLTGFTTARFGHISTSKKRNLFDSDDDFEKMNNLQQPNKEPVPEFMGFSTARGKQIHVSSEMVVKQTNILKNVTVTGNELMKMDKWIGENDAIGETSEKCPSRIEPNSFRLDGPSGFAGFTTARGDRMPMPLALNKVNIFDDLDVGADDLPKMNNWFTDVEHDDSLKSVPSEKTSPKSRLREVTNLTQTEIGNPPKKPNVDTFIKPSPMRRMSMMNSLRRLEASKENLQAQQNRSIDENESDNEKFNHLHDAKTPMSSKASSCITPFSDSDTVSQIAAVFMEDDESTLSSLDLQSKNLTPGWVNGFMIELSASSTPIISKGENHRGRLKQRRLIETFDDIAGEESFESSVQTETLKVSEQIRSLRKVAFAEQERNVKNKWNVKAVPSSLYVKKLTSQKVGWKEFVEHERPVNRLLIDTNLTKNVLNVTSSNATKFKFNAWQHYSEDFCRENVNGIYLPDDIVVMMDENCQIGLTEISTAFLRCPSVDPKLVHHKWIENHMKWIVIKLAAMERSFPHRFAGRALTLENFMLQLKYRYEREIDRAERSAIRRICETDDVSEKRIILFVAGIAKIDGNCVIELSDGWYSLTSTLDFRLAQLVSVGKIKVGTKLVIQGATTLNLANGCHPLDVSSNVQLQIHYNSTRRARWDAKLGYCRHSAPFRISLRSVHGSGGNITKLRLSILRAYPIVYINPKKMSDIHSEKVERRRSVIDERTKSTIVDKIYRQVTSEFEDEVKAARCENRPKKIVKLAEISSINDAAYLCQLLDEDNDPERIQNELTSTQKRMVIDYKDKVNCQRNEEITERVKSKLAAIDKDSPKFVPLLRFKVTGATSFDGTAIVSVWKPSEEIISLIKEGLVFDLSGSSARGVRFDELQIYAGKDAIFQKVNVISQVPVSLCRRVLRISEIISVDQVALNESDTVGLVVHVAETINKFQSVFIADADHNILCINFYESVKFFAYEDLVQPKRFLAIRNLQWRKCSKQKTIPCTYATENSIFIESPQSSDLSSAITNLKSTFATVDLDEFVETCKEKIRSLQSLQSSVSPPLVTPTTGNSSRSVRSPLSNQSRIEQLSKYGEAMATPPLKINSLKKSFKLPVTNT